MTPMTTMDDELRLSDLERRLRCVEMLIRRDARVPLRLPDYEYLYMQSVWGFGDTPELTVATTWAEAFGRITGHGLLELARRINDPMPWVPMLQRLIAMRRVHDEVLLAAAELHLREVARAMLDAQGFAAVEIDECLARKSWQLELGERMAAAAAFDQV